MVSLNITQLLHDYEFTLILINRDKSLYLVIPVILRSKTKCKFSSINCARNCVNGIKLKYIRLNNINYGLILANGKTFIMISRNTYRSKYIFQ